MIDVLLATGGNGGFTVGVKRDLLEGIKLMWRSLHGITGPAFSTK